MRYERRSIWSRLFSVFTIGLLLGSMMILASAVAAEETIKLGVLYSLTGPFAPAGAVAGFRGTKIAIDMVNEKGGVLGKYKVEYVSADARSNPDVAIREAERLIAVEKVPVILGVYSSAIAVPLAEIVEKQKRILWINIAISDAVFKGRNLRYVFRPQPFGSQWGETSVNFLRDEGEAKLGKPLKDITVAILHEDGPYGVSVAKANARRAKELGIKVVMQEAYSHTATDLSSLVLKVRAAQPDIILHTGYFPDIVLFHRQAREMGLKTKAVIGHGAGYANFPKLREALGKGANYLYNVDNAPAQLLDRSKLKPGIGEEIAEFLRRYEKEFGESSPAAHATMGFNHTWIFLNDVLPRAIQKYGGVTPDAIRQAALETDIPEGGTPGGYGVKFAPPGHEMAGQNLRAYPVLMQWINGKVEIVWPPALKTAEPILPLPPDSPYGG